MAQFEWDNFNQCSDNAKAKILKAIMERLYEMPAKGFVDGLIGARANIITAILPEQDPDIQVDIYRRALPVATIQKDRQRLPERGSEEKVGAVKKRALPVLTCDKEKI